MSKPFIVAARSRRFRHQVLQQQPCNTLGGEDAGTQGRLFRKLAGWERAMELSHRALLFLVTHLPALPLEPPPRNTPSPTRGREERTMEREETVPS